MRLAVDHFAISTGAKQFLLKHSFALVLHRRIDTVDWPCVILHRLPIVPTENKMLNNF